MRKTSRTSCAVKLPVLVLMLLLMCFVCAGMAFAEESGGIELLGGSRIEWPCGLPFSDPGWEAIDSEGRDCSELVNVTGEVCVWKAGLYTLRYSFIDSKGKYFETRRSVNVIPAATGDKPTEIAREKTIYLTFDDGPSEYTDKVLDLLDMYDAKASFFVIGWTSELHRDKIEKIYSKGHQLGIHACNHDYSVLYSSEEYFFEDLLSMQELIHEYTGSYATITRFPGGSDTAYRFLDKRTEGGFDTIKQRFDDMGLRYFDWNIQIEADMSTRYDMFNSFKNQVQLYEIPVCLQHDTRLNSVNALELLLAWGTENGYTFAAIDESTPDVQFR